MRLEIVNKDLFNLKKIRDSIITFLNKDPPKKENIYAGIPWHDHIRTRASVILNNTYNHFGLKCPPNCGGDLYIYFLGDGTAPSWEKFEMKTSSKYNEVASRFENGIN